MQFDYKSVLEGKEINIHAVLVQKDAIDTKK